MENQTNQVDNVKDENTKKRNISKVTLMKTFKSLGDRLQDTELLNEKETKQLGELYARAFERFITTF